MPSGTVKKLKCGRTIQGSNPPSDEKLAELHQTLKDYLVEKGLNYTDQRWTIAKLILQTGGHLDAQSVVQRVKRAHPQIGAATVYRAIKVLVEAGILEESHQSKEGLVLYELVDEHHHDHIVCVDCGEIFEFHDDEIEALQDSRARKFDFKVTGHKHVIYGSCTYLKK